MRTESGGLQWDQKKLVSYLSSRSVVAVPSGDVWYFVFSPAKDLSFRQIGLVICGHDAMVYGLMLVT